MLRVRTSIRSFRPDVVQVNKTPYCWVLPFGMPRRTAFVYDVRQLGLWESGTLRARIRNSRAVARMWWHSRMTFDRACYGSAAAAERVLGPGWAKVAVVTPIGVGRSFLEYRRPTRARHDQRSFIYIGTLGRIRRLGVLLEAAALARRSGTTFHLTLMGPGPDAEHFRSEVERLDLGDVVRIADPVPYAGIPRAVAEHDVAVAYVPDVEDWVYQPTLKVLEYRALGMPVLASDIPSNRVVIGEGKNGLLVGNSAEAIAAGITRLVREDGLLARLEQGASAVREGLTWQDIARIHVDKVYTPLLS
jgi:glycosyltransferase involved in cell wall biosynthesis